MEYVKRMYRKLRGSQEIAGKPIGKIIYVKAPPRRVDLSSISGMYDMLRNFFSIACASRMEPRMQVICYGRKRKSKTEDRGPRAKKIRWSSVVGTPINNAIMGAAICISGLFNYGMCAAKTGSEVTEVGDKRGRRIRLKGYYPRTARRQERVAGVKRLTDRPPDPCAPTRRLKRIRFDLAKAPEMILTRDDVIFYYEGDPNSPGSHLRARRLPQERMEVDETNVNSSEV